MGHSSIGMVMRKFTAFILSLVTPFTAMHAEKAPNEETYPVVILGGGVGALTSAIYLQRAGIHAVVIEGQNPGGAIAQSPMVNNWPGEMEIDGSTLVEKIRTQAETNGAEILLQEVTSVDFSKQPYLITTQDLNDEKVQHKIRANTCIIATGATPKFLGIPGEYGENSYWTRGVYSCAVCDGALYKDRTVAVIGGGDSALLEAEYLSKIAKKVYLLVRSGDFRSTESLRKNQLLQKTNVEVRYHTQVKEVQGDGNKVTSLVIKGADKKESKLPVDGVFIAIGANPNSKLFKGQLDIDTQGYIVLKQQQQTSRPGVFAIGDVVDPIYKQAISAAGDGAKAALQAERYLATLPDIKRVNNTASLAVSAPAKAEVVLVKDSQEEVIEVTSMDQLDQEINSSTLPLLVDFYSPYCGPCRKLAPIFEQTAGKYKGRIRFVKVNVSKVTSVSSAYNIYGIPTIIVFKNGKEVDRRTGGTQINPLMNNLDNL